MLQTNLQLQAKRKPIIALRPTQTGLDIQNDMLAVIIENFPGGVLVCDASLHLTACNDQFKALFNLPPALFQKPGLFFEDFVRHNAHRGDYGPGNPEHLVTALVARARELKVHKLERVLANGTALEIRSMPLPEGGFVRLYIDITERKAHQQQLEYLAHFDDLTALPNRVLLADRLQQAMVQAQRRTKIVAVVYLDLDGFKAINNSHGHDTGDRLLTALAVGMKQALREGDTLARLGGDEFVAVLPDLANSQACEPMLTRLLEAAATPIKIGTLLLQVSASLGVSFYPQDEEADADLLMRQADQAMYQAKQSGKNRYQFFDAAQARIVRSHHENIEQIRQALAQREFVLYYQPKVNMRSGNIIGAEALIRWQHPQQGLLAPARFLPLIEDHPLAIDIGEWVINTALTQIERWHASGLDLPVSINVGARQLLQTNFVARLRELMALHPQVKPTSLEIEVLETSALEDLTHVAKVIEDCRSLGVSFAMDDFGTGYSSLTYLKRLQVNLLKIDQSFVRDMLSNPNDLAILQGVIGLAKAFKRAVIAEGVETLAHGTLLQQLGCDLAQGFGIARPMPGADMPKWAAAWQSQPIWIDCVNPA
jgi:diguanylate cyclase (GGDEF)-like protein